MFQKQCIDFALNARPSSRFMPESKDTLKYRIWRLCTSPPFEYFIMAMICINTVILMMSVSYRLGIDQNTNTLCMIRKHDEICTHFELSLPIHINVSSPLSEN